jgi:hypothetical protein
MTGRDGVRSLFITDTTTLYGKFNQLHPEG